MARFVAQRGLRSLQSRNLQINAISLHLSSQYIAEFYQEDPDTYSKEIYELETLRAASYNPSLDISGCNLIKRYYCQLHSLQNRFPIENDHQLVSFSWRDIYSSTVSQSTDVKHDMAVVLHNYGVLHTILGAAINRSTEDEMKLACTHFQCAAWAFETIRQSYAMAANADLMPELLIFMQNICFAQAQECILEKSLIDNRKSIIVAKVTAQIIEYYNSALTALLTGGEDGVITEVVGSKQFKDWRQYVSFKVEYLSCILLLYQGQHAEEQQKMGERVTLYQKAFERLENARKESRGMENAQQIAEALSFVGDVVEAKRKAAKNENEFIYHEEVPEISSIATVPGANLVKGIAFNVVDPAVNAEDIFHRLIPIKTHESSSLYSEEKTNLLRQIRQKIEAKDSELNKFMESLNIDSLNYDPNDVKMPQTLVDRCAELNAKPNAIPDLISKMSSLASICVDVEGALQSIQELLSREDFQERDFQQTMGYRPSSHFVELNREFMKYQEAHSKAGGSNDTLRKAMELHVNNLKILSKPLNEVQAAIPTCNVEIGPNQLSETRNLHSKVNEMRVQRDQLLAQLTENVQQDDITAQLVAWGDKNVEGLFKQELGKHDQLIAIIEQNMVAQGNILKAFTDAYAKCAFFIKAVSDTSHKRESFFSSLIASYDVYDDLLGKSLKGLEFYKKLQSNIHKLLARVKSACDVQDEDRQQRLQSLSRKAAEASAASVAAAAPQSSAPAPSMYPDPAKPAVEYDKYESYRTPSVRPTPIGQENIAGPSACVAPASYAAGNAPAAYQYSMPAPASRPSVPTSTFAYDGGVPAAAHPSPSSRANAPSYDGQSQQHHAYPVASAGDARPAVSTAPSNAYYSASNPPPVQMPTTIASSGYQSTNMGKYSDQMGYYAPTSQQMPYANYAPDEMMAMTSHSSAASVHYPAPVDYNAPAANQQTLTSYSNYSSYAAQPPQPHQQPFPPPAGFGAQGDVHAPVSTSAYGYGNAYPQQPMSSGQLDAGVYADPSGYYYNNYQPVAGQQYYADPNSAAQYVTQAGVSYSNQYAVPATPNESYQQYYASNAMAPPSSASYQPASSNVGYGASHASTAAPAAPPEVPRSAAPVKQPEAKANTRIDLMSDLDAPIPAPTLQPIKSDSVLVPSKPPEPKEPAAEHPRKSTVVKSHEILVDGKVAVAEVECENTQNPDEEIENALRQMSMTDSFTKSETLTKSNASSTSDVHAASTAAAAPSALNIETFFKEVQRYEKSVHSLQTKTLNGTTPLDIKWKELNDLLVRLLRLGKRKSRDELMFQLSSRRKMRANTWRRWRNCFRRRIAAR